LSIDHCIGEQGEEEVEDSSSFLLIGIPAYYLKRVERRRQTKRTREEDNEGCNYTIMPLRFSGMEAGIKPTIFLTK